MTWAATVDAFASHYPGWTEQTLLQTRQSTLDRLPIVWRVQRERAEADINRQKAAQLANDMANRR